MAILNLTLLFEPLDFGRNELGLPILQFSKGWLSILARYHKFESSQIPHTKQIMV